MAPIVNETETQTGAARNAHAASSAQPVALEVPVTVNGARTVEGSDKREPFSEATKTVLIFAHGAVIRLASSMAPGQLLFLTNESSKKEVVCQVVKSKNYRNVSGYVELEFTEPAPNFWGMRFPGERTVPASHARTAPVPAPARSSVTAKLPPQKSEPKTPESFVSYSSATKSPAPHSVEKPAPSKPAPSDIPAPPVPAITQARQQTASVIDFPRATESRPATFLEDTRGSSVPSWLVPQSNTDTLQHEAAVVQEKPSPSLVTDSAAKTNQISANLENSPAPELTVEAAEVARKEDNLPVPPAMAALEVPLSQNAKTSSLLSTLDLDAEEVRIPAWLEPLARNAAPATPSLPSTSASPLAPSKPAEQEEAREHAESEPISIQPAESEDSAPTFGTQLLGENSESNFGATRSSKGLLIGVLAAGLILAAAGGAWYFRSPRSATAPATDAPSFATLPRSTPPAETASEVKSPDASSAQPNIVPAAEKNQIAPARVSSPANPATTLSTEAAKELAKMESARKRERLANKSAQTETRKPVLGDVQLAAPVVNSNASTQENLAAPGLNLGSDPSTVGDTGNVAFLAGHSKQPKAPVPVGGDVKPARLLHSIPPAYPSLARNQHVSGDVLIDAFIDAAGHVSTMKVISGPVLLHQAAMDAVRQWRYQPAMLDDKPVSMHLTVKVQFRM